MGQLKIKDMVESDGNSKVQSIHTSEEEMKRSNDFNRNMNLVSRIIKDEESREKIITKDGSEGVWYKEFKRAFPIKDERETPDDIIYLLKKSEKHPENQDYIVISLEIEDEGKGKVIGGATANRLTSDDYTVAVFSYVFLNEEYREKGLGTLLTKARLDEVKRQADNLGSKFVAALAETENPEKMSAESLKKEGMNLKTRRNILSKWNYKIIDFPYVQLPLNEDSKHVRHLDFLVNPVGEKKDEWKNHIPSKDLKDILDMYFETFGNEDFRSDPEYKKMIDYISKKEKISLKPLG